MLRTELPQASLVVMPVSPTSRIIASRACAEEMDQRRPEERTAMMRNWRDYGEAGAAWHDLYDGIFDFEGLVYTPPTETFERELKLRVVPEPHDVSDALAIALCHYYSQREWASLARRSKPA